MNLSYNTFFDSVNEFTDYITPPGSTETMHEISTEKVPLGKHCHKSWIVKESTESHRGYPTIRLGYSSPCLITLELEVSSLELDNIPSDQRWFSPLTVTDDMTDSWGSPITLTLDYSKYLTLMHVPKFGFSNHLYQASLENKGAIFPLNKKVVIDMYVDMSPNYGYAKVWQDGDLVSHAEIRGRQARIGQIHAGMYAHKLVKVGMVYNYHLSVKEVSDEVALALYLALTRK